ncbi:hypothetical protein OAI86_01975 [Alphaproteobacteria bacterium]|nr:hypothetical protein [Alphaproteobacteria bacterium]
MLKLMIFLKFIYLFTILSLNASANEVGNKIFVVNPVAKPIYISKSGTKYYPCNGYVNKKLIPIIYNELKMLAKLNKISPPDGKICHYKIGKLKFGSRSITTYSVDMYINKSSMMSCAFKNYCTDFRSMFFKVKNKKIHRSYFVTNVGRKLTRMMCISNSGEIVTATKGC